MNAVGSAAPRWRPHVLLVRPGRSEVATAVLAVLLLAALVAGVLAGAGRTAVPAGLPDAGVLVEGLAAAARTVVRLAAIGCLGSLLALSWLAWNGPDHHPDVVTACARWARVWLVACLVQALATSAEVLGVPAGRVLVDPEVWRFVPELAEGRALLVTGALAAVVATFAPGTRQRSGAAALLGVAFLGLLPLAVTGHAASAANHYLASQTTLAHVVAASVWVGGLVGLVHLRRSPWMHLSVHRFSLLALPAYAAVALSGLVGGWLRLGLDPAAWRSSYGTVLLVKAALLVGLGVAGVLHRRWTLRRLDAGRPRAFWGLVAAELATMALATALAVTLARTAAPARAGVVDAPHPGQATLDPAVGEPRWAGLLLSFRPDALVVTVLVVATIAFVLALRIQWLPPRQALGAGAAWVGAVGVTAWAMLGGPGAYGGVLLTAHLLQLLCCLLVVPPLLLRATASFGTPRPWRWLDDPVDAVLPVAALLLLVYGTSMLEVSLASQGTRLALDAIAVALGVLVAAVARTHGPATTVSFGAVVLVFAVAAWFTPDGLGREWFEGLALAGVDPGTDHRVATGVAAAAGVGLLVVSAVQRLRLRGQARTERASTAWR